MFISKPQRFISHTLLSLALFVLLATPATSQAQVEKKQTNRAPYTAQEIVLGINEAREDAGLSKLTVNSKLALAAQVKAKHMATNSYFSHYSPDGSTPWDFMDDAGYNYTKAGENLAIHFFETEDMVDAWLNSPGHRANIMNGDYRETGIGIAYGKVEGEKGWMVVQMFGSTL